MLLNPVPGKNCDRQQRIELPLSAAEEIAPHLEVPVMMVEIHPTHDRLEVGLVHLNENRA